MGYNNKVSVKSHDKLHGKSHGKSHDFLKKHFFEVEKVFSEF